MRRVPHERGGANPGVFNASALHGGHNAGYTCAMTLAPRLETPRLILRGHTEADFAASAAMWSHPDVVRHILGRASTRQESWFRVLRHAGQWVVSGFGYWLVERRDTGVFVGEVGFGKFLRELPRPDADEDQPEAGWVLTPESFGQGLATEAMQAALAWMDIARAGQTTGCIIAVENTPSVRVATKLGYRPSGSTSDGQGEVLLFSRTPLQPS
jgi:RimJ/RimL family protein N-acetyltransferase